MPLVMMADNYNVVITHSNGETTEIPTEEVRNIEFRSTEVKPPVDPDEPAKGVIVMKPGDYNSKFYRIPALEVLPDGTLVLVADKRIESNGDLPGKIDVVTRRSTDGGHTWSPYVTIAEHDAVGGYGDPSIIRDRNTGDLIVISNHGHGLWENAPSRTCVSRSSDGGLTWSDPVDISDQLFTTDPNGKQPIKLTSGFASSGHSLQLANGRLMYVYVSRKAGVEGFINYAIYSDDGGYNWKVSSTPATENGDEAKVVELSDGRLMMSIRARNSTQRRFSISMDGGDTWKLMSTMFGKLKDVNCNGDIVSVMRNGKEVLLHSLPAGPGRSHISIFYSLDSGKNWSSRAYLVSAKEGAYSSMVVLPDGEHVGIVTEEQADGYSETAYNLQYYKISIADILGEKTSE